MSKEFTKEEIIGKQFNLDLGSLSPVSVIVKDIKQDIDLSGNIDKVIVEYLHSTPGRTEEFTLSNFEYLACIEIISTETKMKFSSLFETTMRDKIEELLDMSDPITKSHYMIWDTADGSAVGLCEILLEQLIRNHKKDNGEYYDTDYDQIKLRYQNKEDE